MLMIFFNFNFICRLCCSTPRIVQVKALFTSRFDSLEEGQRGSLSDLAFALDELHESIKSIETQTAEIKAISLNQMQVLTQLFDNESDIPRLILLFKKEHGKTFMGLLNEAGYKMKTLG